MADFRGVGPLTSRPGACPPRVGRATLLCLPGISLDEATKEASEGGLIEGRAVARRAAGRRRSLYRAHPLSPLTVPLWWLCAAVVSPRSLVVLIQALDECREYLFVCYRAFERLHCF